MSTATKQIPMHKRQSAHIYVYLIDPLPDQQMDMMTREVFMLKDILVTSCADALLTGKISRFGIKANMNSD